MIEARWEIGSHSITHADLTLDHNQARYEVHDSKLLLGDELGVDINTFAYPFGTIDSYIAGRVVTYGYTAGMGLGPFWEHGWDTLFYLSRIEVYGYLDLEGFGNLLPWTDPLTAADDRHRLHYFAQRVISV